LEYLTLTVAPYYASFMRGLNLSLEKNGVETDFDAVRWSCQSMDTNTRNSLHTWLRNTKSDNPNLIDALLFRAPKETLPYEPSRDGLLFSGLQDGSLSAENMRDLGLYMSTLDIRQPDKHPDVNGDNGKRSVSLPGLTQSWDSMVQTSSSLFSALSFGTVPAKRSPLASPAESPNVLAKNDPFNKPCDARWIVGGDNEGRKIWLEAGGERAVPISLGNERPGFLREASGQESPGDDGLIQLQLSVYKVGSLHSI
jgi:hypothetical protein